MGGDISLLEKTIVNWALIPDAVFYTARAHITGQYYGQTFTERCKTVWKNRVSKYKKMLTIQKKYGTIPERIRRTCIKGPCAHTRLLLTYLYRNVYKPPSGFL